MIVFAVELKYNRIYIITPAYFELVFRLQMLKDMFFVRCKIITTDWFSTPYLQRGIHDIQDITVFRINVFKYREIMNEV